MLNTGADDDVILGGGKTGSAHPRSRCNAVLQNSSRVMLFIEQQQGLAHVTIGGQQFSYVSVTLFPMNQVSTEIDDPFLRRGCRSYERASARCAHHEFLGLGESIGARYCAERDVKVFGEFAMRWQLFAGRQPARFDIRL